MRTITQTDSRTTRITFVFEVPSATLSPFEFRRAFVSAIRDAIAGAQLDGRIDAPLAVEMFRALPTQEPRQ
jgi:hypothetical protein